MKTKTMNWYAVRVQNNKEKKVLEEVKRELEHMNLSDRLGKAIIPTEKSVTMREGKKYIREKMVYPGYIFIETSAVGEMTNLFKGINGAGGFVRTRAGEVIAMKDREVKKIYTEQKVADDTDYKSIFLEGESVNVIDGPFNTFNGKISKINEGKETATVQITIFGRITDVELNFGQIEKRQD